MPSNYVIGGTVYFRESGLAQVLANVELGNFQWGAPYKVKVSGFDLVTGGILRLLSTQRQLLQSITQHPDTLTMLVKIMDSLNWAG